MVSQVVDLIRRILVRLPANFFETRSHVAQPVHKLTVIKTNLALLILLPPPPPPQC